MHDALRDWSAVVARNVLDLTLRPDGPAVVVIPDKMAVTEPIPVLVMLPANVVSCAAPTATNKDAAFLFGQPAGFLAPAIPSRQLTSVAGQKVVIENWLAHSPTLAQGLAG